MSSLPPDLPPGPEDAAPAGFVYLEGRGPFSAHNGPFYARPVAEGVEHGFRVRARHCNSYSILHGGLLAGFIDGVLAHAVFAVARRPAVTLRLTADYLGMARKGAWVTARARAGPVQDDLVHAEAIAEVADGAILSARAVFKLMAERPRAR
jgi:acyl-coenzyme A thioesterase PaaI-like protein